MYKTQLGRTTTEYDRAVINEQKRGGSGGVYLPRVRGWFSRVSEETRWMGRGMLKWWVTKVKVHIPIIFTEMKNQSVVDEHICKDKYHTHGSCMPFIHGER